MLNWLPVIFSSNQLLLLPLSQEHYNYSFQKVHLIGYSLGAHISGFAGSHFKGRDQIGRITGEFDVDKFEDVFDLRHADSWWPLTFVQVWILPGRCLKACRQRTGCRPTMPSSWTPFTRSPTSVWASVWASSKLWLIMTFTPMGATSNLDATCTTSTSTSPSTAFLVCCAISGQNMMYTYTMKAFIASILPFSHMAITFSHFYKHVYTRVQYFQLIFIPLSKR